MPRLTSPCSCETPLARCDEPEAHDGHVEDARVAALVVLGAEREDPLDRDAGAGVVAAEVLRDQVAGEAVDAGRDRGVRGEDRAGARHLERGVEVEALVLGELADPLEAEEAGVALVGVEDLGRRGAGELAVGADGADAADAEQHLLAQPVLGVAAVEPVGDVAQDARCSPRRRCRAAAAGRGRPGRPRCGRARSRPPGMPTVIAAGGALAVAQQRERELVGVEDRVGLLLPAVARERLAEVAVPVEQADADDRHAEVAGGLEVVAGEDAEAAAVLRQHRGDAELRGEVGDRARARRRPGSGTTGRSVR